LSGKRLAGESMGDELTKPILEKFLMEVMKIERRYANELKNAKSNRRSDIRDLMERFVVQELEHED
jgi:hypothetical protein